MKTELKLDYMPHVDGLRAIAVLSVIFFHFAIPGFEGGYIGVDIFFVISGFLITRLISHEIKTTGGFNFLHFYKRRIRRLLPALFFVLTISSIVAAILLTPENLIEFGVSLPAAALSVSNILFWFQSGYFDTASHLKPLLHTWSLSVEEQYYLIWPAFMVLVWRTSSAFYKLALIALMGLISFYLNYYFVSKAEPGFNSTIFFLAPFRVFEFTIGALGIFLIGSKYLKSTFQELIALTGIALILTSLLLLNSKSIFPYINALAPCLGALFIILAQDSKIIKWLFGNKLTISIGLISYSLYLVHWPIYVFTKYSWLNISSIFFVTAMLLVTIILAVFVYHFVETPFRKANAKLFFKSIAFFCACICLVGWSMSAYSGWQWRTQWSAASGSNGVVQNDNNSTENKGKLFLNIEEIESGKSRRFKDYSHACHLTEINDISKCDMQKPIQILVFGNSHEPDGFNMLNSLYKDNPNVNLIVFGTVNDCVVELKEGQFSSPTTAANCAHRFSVLNSDEFLKKITHVFYNSHFALDYIAKDLWEIMEIISRKNGAIKIIAAGSYIATSIDCATLINKTGSVDACKSKDANNYFYPNERDISVLPQVKSMNYLYISKYELLCQNNQLESCATYAGNEPMFYDQHHLSYGFARHVGQLMWVRYGDALKQHGLPQPEVGMLVLP
jgi:peptidoglycan/LPS O-acetylase OafA/YrhL